MLPKTFPPFPDRTDFDLHAFLKAAKVVGGDLFDYFLMDENRLYFLIGDVSDKGIPASLFMAITKAIFKSHFSNQNCGEIADEVYRINGFLSADNQTMMFVTAFIGILDLTTGVVEYVDAGHEPPLILRKNNQVEVLRKKEDWPCVSIANFRIVLARSGWSRAIRCLPIPMELQMRMTLRAIVLAYNA